MNADERLIDRRRFGVIETRFFQRGRVAAYNLTINRQLWACVEWSPTRRAWCVQDASGRCLAHCDAIHGQDVDAQTAVVLAKAMIRDGRMPTPEDAERQLQERLRLDDQARNAGAEVERQGEALAVVMRDAEGK
jgi:hypothetical protein